MSPGLIFVLMLLGGCMVAFASDRVRLDVVALLVILALPLSGVLTVPEALQGFSDPNVLLIALLFVIGEGLVRTGVAYRMGEWLSARAGKSEARLVVLLMGSAGLLGSVMSSTGVVAIFIPIALAVSRKMQVPVRRVLMPLSFAGLISGMMTLVATPPNMVVDSALRNAGLPGLSFFSVTPVGAIMLVLGIGYMLVARHWLQPHGAAGQEGEQGRTPGRSLVDFIRDYHLEGRVRRVAVRADSPLAGLSLEAWNPRRELGANAIAIERATRFDTQLVHPRAETLLAAGDVLLLESPLGTRLPVDLPPELGLETQPLRSDYFTDPRQEIGMAEILITPDSVLIGKSVVEAGFRRHYQLHVVGLRRKRDVVRENALETTLELGDTLLVSGSWRALRRLQAQHNDFIVLRFPAEMEQTIPAPRRAPLALGSLAVMVLLMVTGAVPNVLAALIGCLLMAATGCVDAKSAYRSLHWQSLVLIAGMIPFALALERTGGVDLAVAGLMTTMGSAAPILFLVALFALTAGISLFISNTATAVLMAPIAMRAAEQLGASPYPFVLTVALAASAAFMTPVSSPVNTLVLGPGGYTFMDFVKVGVPFALVVLVVTVLVIPLFYPVFP